MKTETRYIAEDGREFKTADECSIYEARLSSSTAVNLWLEQRYAGKGQRVASMMRTVLMDWEAERDSFINPVAEAPKKIQAA